MKKTLFISLAFVSLSIQAKIEHLLPTPQQVTMGEGSITYDENTPISISMVDAIDGAYDYTLKGFENEAYRLTVNTAGVKIEAITQTGVIRAKQTLTQMAEGWEGTPQLECCTIVDWPAFKLRGLMHDVGRDYIDYDELKHEVELLSRFKMNVFHWHLTDHQGFRFESKTHPELNGSKAFTRASGKYYTQAQCTELEAFARERGVIIIPEIDMPGHSTSFSNAMGFDMISEQGQAVCLDLIDELCQAFPLAPYIHIGADETSVVTTEFLKKMTDRIHSHDRLSVVWNKLGNNAAPVPSTQGIDMTQMWATRGAAVSGVPNIDCRYNYINHFDVFADPIGIYKSNVYYKQKGDATVAGAITAIWTDRKTVDQWGIIRQNNLYVNVLVTTERCWRGGGSQYIEKGGTLLPYRGDEYEEFADWERRFLFHKANSLSGEQIPYVKQTNIRWRITDAFPNSGSTSMQFPPETLGPRESYTYNGTTYGTGLATGAAIYLRHTWGTTVPGFYSDPQTNQTAYAWTYVYSPVAQTVGAQIEFQNYARSEKDLAPANGTWDYKGSKVWVNGNEVTPPTWLNAGKSIGSETDLQNENFTERDPRPVELKEGWNLVFLKLPYISLSSSTVRLNKWMFTFVLTDLEGKNAVDGLIYSPSKRMDGNDDMPDEGAVQELINQADSLLNLTDVGYPSADSKARTNLASLVEQTRSDISLSTQLQEAIDAYLASTDVKLPEEGHAYTLTNVQQDGSTRSLYFDESGLQVGELNTPASDYGDKAVFYCNQYGNYFALSNPAAGYLVVKGGGKGYNSDAGYMPSYDSKSCNLRFKSGASLQFGTVYWAGYTRSSAISLYSNSISTAGEFSRVNNQAQWSSSSSNLFYMTETSIPTGIESKEQEEQGRVYDLLGRPATSPRARNIYIRKGTKTIY